MSERELVLYFISFPKYKQRYLRRKYEKETGKDSSEMFEVSEYLNGSRDTLDFLKWVHQDE